MSRMFINVSNALALAATAFILFAVGTPAYAARGAGCMPAALRAKLNEIESKFGPVQVISGHRPGARIAGSGRVSLHASCQAVDFNPPPGKYQQVANWLKANHNGGVGTYSCGMNHIHIDTGGRVRFHKCQGNGSRWVSKSRGSKRYAYKARGGKRYAYKSRSGGRYADKSRSGKRYASGSRSGRYASAKYRSGRYSNSRGYNRKRYSSGNWRRGQG